MKNTTVRASVALLALIAGACLLSACGGAPGSAESLLSETFSGQAPIESGNVKLSFALSASGQTAGTQPLAVALSGPFESASPGKIPRFDLQLKLTAAGQPLSAGATSTGSALYVQLAGAWFSIPSSTYKHDRRRLRQGDRHVHRLESPLDLLGAWDRTGALAERTRPRPEPRPLPVPPLCT